MGYFFISLYWWESKHLYLPTNLVISQTEKFSLRIEEKVFVICMENDNTPKLSKLFRYIRILVKRIDCITDQDLSMTNQKQDEAFRLNH